MNFLEYRKNNKFSNQLISEKDKNIIYKLLESKKELEEIPYNILLAIKIKNKNLYFEFISIENKIIRKAINSENIKNDLKKYEKFLGYLYKFYKMNQKELDSIIEKESVRINI